MKIIAKPMYFLIFSYTWPFVPYLAVFCEGMKTSTSVFETSTLVASMKVNVGMKIIANPMHFLCLCHISPSFATGWKLQRRCLKLQHRSLKLQHRVLKLQRRFLKLQHRFLKLHDGFWNFNVGFLKLQRRCLNVFCDGWKLNSQAARHLYPALTVKVLFSLDFIYLVSLDRISGGYQEDILEQFEKSKMAAKMAAIVKKKLNHLILFIKSRVISLFPLNVIRGIHFWG